MRTLKLESEVEVYDDRNELPEWISKLLAQAEEAATRAYAPYSHFQVGAAVQMDNGEVITGSNQENAVFPCGLCAERTAAFAASAKYPDVPFKAIAITAINPEAPLAKPVSPCGSCRQALYEYEQKFNNHMEVILAGQSGPVFVFHSVEDLLPYTFNAGFMS